VSFFSVFVLSDIMLNVILLSVHAEHCYVASFCIAIMQSVVMLNVILLSVTMPDIIM